MADKGVRDWAYAASYAMETALQIIEDVNTVAFLPETRLILASLAAERIVRIYERVKAGERNPNGLERPVEKSEWYGLDC